MALINTKKQSQVIHTFFGEAGGTRIEIITEAALTGAARDTPDEFSLNIWEERKSFEQAIDNFAKATTNHLSTLKERLNTLVAINRLPLELFTSIIFLAHLPTIRYLHPYIPYTWVCRYWRSVLVETPVFWTTIQIESESEEQIPFIHELIRRSKTSGLDITLILSSEAVISQFEDIFARECYRIRELRLGVVDKHLVRLISGKYFPALRGIFYYGEGLVDIMPTLLTSDRLEALEWVLSDDTSINVITKLGASIFGRITSLDLNYSIPTSLHSILDLLHNNINLQNPKLGVCTSHDTNSRHPQSQVGNPIANDSSSSQIILPGLQYLSTRSPPLLEHILVPKLSSLDIYNSNPVIEIIPKTFIFSSIRYLYIFDYPGCKKYAILGFKDRTYVESSYSRNESFIGDTGDIRSTEHMNSVHEIFSCDIISGPYPRDCFRLEFNSQQTFMRALGTLLSSLLPQMKGLTELYLMSFAFGYEDRLGNFLAAAPSVEKVVVKYCRALTTYISPFGNVSSCPRLKNLSFITDSAPFISSERVGDYVADVGNALVQCISSRHRVYGNALEYIALHRCPPLPEICVKELRRLGATVATAKDTKRIIRQEHETSDEETTTSDDSDM